MGEKDDGLGLGLGLGLSLSLGCGGNLQTSVKMNPMHNKPQPSQMVQNHDKKSSPWNEMFQFPGNLSVFCSCGFYFSLSKFPGASGSIRSIIRPFSANNLSGLHPKKSTLSETQISSLTIKNLRSFSMTFWHFHFLLVLFRLKMRDCIYMPKKFQDFCFQIRSIRIPFIIFCIYIYIHYNIFLPLFFVRECSKLFP
jgi:hypothetical protein